jgi:hypothetical protein
MEEEYYLPPKIYHNPYEPMFGEFPYPYLLPYQSRYHNLGLNGYYPFRDEHSIYPGKRPGLHGDWSQRQQGCINPSGVYPLDSYVLEHQWAGPHPVGSLSAKLDYNKSQNRIY